jgi:protein O-mannosyl-transferase
MQTAPSRKQPCFSAVCIALAMGTFVLFLPVVHNDFINLDDGVYIYQNPHVASGLSWENIRWSFEHVYAGYWAPLTWISHMIDCSLFGLHPAGHHLVNVLIHTVNAVLLFILLNYMTGTTWRSAFVAAAFAWHPLRVESVAWACERKDVLSGLFWLLTLLCYVRSARSRVHGLQSTVQSPPMAVNPPSSILHFLSSPIYWLALLFFACGLMSKPMVVTLPCVLLLLDFWPLQRFNASTLQRLILEKIPFFALSLIDCIATYRNCDAGASSSTEPLSFRMIHSFWGYLQYISKTFMPIHLAVLYPLPAHIPIALGLVGAVLVLGFTIAFAVMALSPRWPRCQPLLVGWLWFLGTLVPVIGIVQSGYQSMADRFTYLPCIGFFIVMAWGLADLVQLPGDTKPLPHGRGSVDFVRWPRGKSVLVAVAVAWLAGCVVITSLLIPHWHNSITVFRRALAVTTDNYVACACLGQALDDAGEDQDALPYCQEAVRLNPDYAAGQFFLGEALAKTGDPSNALTHLDISVQWEPDNAPFQYNVGKFLLEHRKTDEAISHFTIALRVEPDLAEAHNGLGKAYLKQGALQKAADELSQAVALKSNDAQFHYDLATVLLDGSQPAQAIAQFSEAIRIQPDFALAHENLGIAFTREGKMSDAITHFARAVQLQPNDPEARFNLGFACLNDHQAAQAVAQFQEEVRLTPNETKVHYRLAQALRDENQWAQAVDEYRQALRLAPDFADAKKEMNEILAAHPGVR